MDVTQQQIRKLAVIVQTLWGGPERNVYISLPSIWHQSQQVVCLVTWIPVLCSGFSLPEIKQR